MQKGFTTFMKTERGFAPILIVILIALAVGGYFVYKNQQKPASVPQQATQPSPTNSDETANWKTYTSSKHGFTFKYPPNMSTSENIDGSVFVNNIFFEVIQVPQKFNNAVLTRSELDRAQKASLDKYYIDPETDRQITKMGEFTVDSVLFTKLQWEVGDIQKKGKTSFREGFVAIKGNNLYILPSYEFYPAKQILSTFRFD